MTIERIVTGIVALLFLGTMFYLVRWGQKMLSTGEDLVLANQRLFDQNVALTRQQTKSNRTLEHLASGMEDVVTSTGKHYRQEEVGPASVPITPKPPAKRAPRRKPTS